MSDSIKLSDAIKANRHGIDRLIAMQSEYRRKQHEWAAKADDVGREISAHMDMQRAMEAVQAVYPSDETIKFVVPRVS